MQHPQRGLLGPEHFLTVAEASGLIEPIGAPAVEIARETLRQHDAPRTPL